MGNHNLLLGKKSKSNYEERLSFYDLKEWFSDSYKEVHNDKQDVDWAGEVLYFSFLT